MPISPTAPSHRAAIQPTESKLAAFTQPLQHIGLASSNLAEALAAEPLVVLYFLRHFGCVHCSHVVGQLRRLRDENPRFPPIIFVHQEKLEVGRAYFASNCPGARHISDPKRALYALFDIGEAGPWSVLSPAMLFNSLGRMLMGSRQKWVPTANPLTLSGMFLVKAGTPIWAHRAKTAYDDQAALAKLSQLGKMA